MAKLAAVAVVGVFEEAHVIRAVTLNQEQFRVPTLRADARGLVVGERALLRFAILPHVVAFFRAFTRKHSLDSLASSLRIVKVRSKTAGIELLVDLPVQGSYQLDSAARIARLLRGEVYTGSWPHFVPYRDRQAPLGYDAQELVSWSEGAVLYGRHAADKLSLDGELAFQSLLFDLSLERVKRVPTTRALVRVPLGLRGPMQKLLWRRQVEAGIAQVVREPRSKLDHAESFFLFAIHELTPALCGVLDGLPGVELYHPLGDRLYVQRGFAHPFALESCQRFFESDKLVFFCGTRGAVEVCAVDKLEFVPLGDLRAQAVTLRSELSPQATTPAQPDAAFTAGELQPLELRVDLISTRLLHFEPPTAAWITEPRELGWLVKLIHALPQRALEECSIALTQQGVLLTHPSHLEWFPLGLQLRELAPRIYAPLGSMLSPRIAPAHLSAALAHSSMHVSILADGLETPLLVPLRALHPLAKALLPEFTVLPLDELPSARETLGESELRSEVIGRFALWRQNLLRPSITADAARALPK